MESLKNSNEKSKISQENIKKLEIARKEVEHIVDTLGLGIDEGIKDMIATLRAMDFPTSSSCAGHTEQDGYCPPYIEIYAKAPEGWEEDKEKQMLWKEENLKQQKRLLPLLQEFNENRNTLVDARLVLHYKGQFGGFRVQNAGTKSPELLNLPLKPELNIVFEKIRLYQKEMNAFCEFLKSRFLENK